MKTIRRATLTSVLRASLIVLFAITTSIPAIGGPRHRPQAPHQPRVPGQVLVKLKEDVQQLPLEQGNKAGWAKGHSKAGEHPLHARLRKVKAKSGKQLYPARKNPIVGLAARVGHAGRGRAVENGRKKLERWYRFDLPEDADVDAAIAELRQDDTVEFAEPNYEYQLSDIPPPISGLPDGTTDPGMVEQYYLTQTTVQQGWNHLKGDGVNPGGTPDVVIAVIDTGVDYTHPDLIANMWTNPAEIPDNGIDDDGNGYVDDIHGCSTVGGTVSHHGDPADSHGHGTHVAGIAAATAFNGQGGAGVAFGTRIMAVQAAQYSGTLTSADATEGIIYATEQGAEVINMSFGGYARSQLMVDALAMALNQAVLVAAAGNDGQNTYPSYPASLPWVIGVMSCDPIGIRSWFSNSNNPAYPPWYEVTAPGESIYSTLPGDSYAKWSGTSMATPVVAGIGALMRSYFWQRDIYSSRFLMGSIAGSGSGEIVDCYRALTEPPAPGVTLYENWLFDDTSVHPDSDGDGRIDAGETVQLAVELINRSGMAENVTATLRAHAQGAALDDPYVTIPVDTVSFGNMGPFVIDDNGLNYNQDGVITGVEMPFVVEVSPDCPNDHVIPFELTIQFDDGWNPDGGSYTRVSRFNYVVQRGVNVPTVIPSGETLVLDPDQFWIVGGPVLVEEGATLQVLPGTQVQWGAVSDDPYNPGPQSGYILVRGNIEIEGSEDDPVELLPSYLVAGQTVQIQMEGSGRRTMRYAQVQNPKISGFQVIDHCHFHWDRYSSTVESDLISHSAFHKFRGGGGINALVYDTVLFDAGMGPASPLVMRDSVFLQDNEFHNPVNLDVRKSFSDPLTNSVGDVPFWAAPTLFSGETFVVLPMERVSLRLAESIANFYGGHVASVRSQEEADFLESYLPGVANFRRYGSGQHDWVYIGLADWETPGDYRWLDGSPTDFTDWAPDHPAEYTTGAEHLTQVLDIWNNGATLEWGWRDVVQSDSIRTGHGGVSSWKSFVLRLPGEWTLEQLNEPVDSGVLFDYLKDNFHQRIRHNAFLSKNWDPNIGHWMHVTAPWGSNLTVAMKDNYWGTDTPELVDLTINDYYDGFTRARIHYGTPPAHGFESTWPFVESVAVNGIPIETVPSLETGLATFTVTFNRDMDTSEAPYVTFGPAVPFTDFSVKPIDNGTNGWTDARTWEGTFYVVPVTGDGYHQMRISDAVAADDPWLISGYDVGRFRFKVQTMGVAAMTLQAEGREGAVHLGWQQNDFDLIAGYNLYRSNSIDGTYSRINNTLIPIGTESFTDHDVTPGTPMFYQFSVLLTDFTESDRSNVASAAAIDTIAPVIVHTPVSATPPGSGAKITATVTDNLSVATVTAFYRSWGGTEAFSEVPMIRIEGDRWTGTIPGGAVLPPGLEYYLVASDGIGTAYSGTVASPYVIAVSAAPTITSISPPEGASDGGTLVTISGSLFQEGAEVLFGGAPASDVQVISGGQIACSCPPHFPGLVDVRVVNPDSTEAMRLNGYRFVTDETLLTLPNASGDQGALVEIPLELSNVNGLVAAEGVLTYDPAILSIDSVHLGTLTQGWTLSSNTGTGGRIQFAMANATAVGGSGSVVVARFLVIGSSSATSPLQIESALLNDGAISWQGADGVFTVTGRFSVSGAVRYFAGDTPVEGCDLTLAGSGLHTTATDAAGTFSFAEVLTGSYTLTPSKSGEVDGITAYDASLVLQDAAGTLVLTADETTAADVNRNGAVSSMDAVYLLQKSVGLIETPFPGAGRTWDFVPSQREYPLLTADQTGQDFRAILIGDVSGSWTPPGPAPGPALQGGPGSEVGTIVSGIPLPTGNRYVVRVVTRSVTPSVVSADLVLAHHPSAQLVSSSGALTMAVNDNDAGIIRVGMAGGDPVPPETVLLTLVFESDVYPGVTLQSVSFNESNLTAVSSQELGDLDADEDGLLDIDEIEYLHTSPSVDDSDGDGNPDHFEVIAGTDPADRLDRFTMDWVSDGGPSAGIQLQWPTKAGRTYTLERADSPAGLWTGFHQVSGDGSLRSHSVPTEQASEFFRIRIQLDE